jgi:hypothetical protein
MFIDPAAKNVEFLDFGYLAIMAVPGIASHSMIDLVRGSGTILIRA